MKKGLLHDLLTRGIDDSGQLRPPQHLAPELYKDSPLGWIPKEWLYRTLHEVYEEPSRNGMYKPNIYHGRGPLMVQMGGMFKGEQVSFSGASRVDVTPYELKTYGLSEGDLLFGRRSLVLEGAGKCSLVSKLPEPSTFESSIVRVKLKKEVLIPEFASLFLNSDISYLQRRKFIRQVAVSGVSSSDIAEFPIIEIPINEQKNIITKYQTSSERIQREETKLEKLKKQKSGLMNDLLTGKVRVTSLL